MKEYYQVPTRQHFSSQDIKILNCLLRGVKLRAIAEEVGTSYDGIKTTLGILRNTLEVRDNTQLVYYLNCPLFIEGMRAKGFIR